MNGHSGKRGFLNFNHKRENGQKSQKLFAHLLIRTSAQSGFSQESAVVVPKN